MPISRAAAEVAVMDNKLGRTNRKAATVATVALACVACCVLPIAFPAIVLSGAGSILAWWGSAKLWVTSIAALAVIIGWLWVWRQSKARRTRPASATLWLMGLATFALIAAIIWPRFEPMIIRTVSG